MAKKADKQTVETSNIAPTALVGSYTKETASNLLRKNGVMLRHKDVKQELLSKDSVYRQLMRIPALAIHNHSLMQHVLQSKEYVQEKLTNIIFAVTSVQAQHPSTQKPLSNNRQELYNRIQDRCNFTAKEVFSFSRQHNEHYAKAFDNLKQYIQEWRRLCKNSAMEICNSLRDKGHELPEDFSEILQKHLERSGGHPISANELSAMNIKGKLSYTQMALVCALKELEKSHA